MLTLLFPKVVPIEQAPLYTAPFCKKSMCHLLGLKTLTSTILRNIFSFLNFLKYAVDNGHKTPYPKNKNQNICNEITENNYQVSVKLQVRFWGVSCAI